jgi:hypothetical protein
VEDAPGERRGGEVDSGWQEGLGDSSGEREEAVERGQEGVADDSSQRQVRQSAVGAGGLFPALAAPFCVVSHRTKQQRNTVKTIRKPGFTSNTPRPLPRPITVRADGFYGFREWQKRAYEQLKPERLRLINAPMGSGKTFEICALAYDDMFANPAMKCVIGVPQKIIADGFREHNIEFPDGRKHRWTIIPANDLMDDTPDCINRFLSFLQSPIGNPLDIYGRTLLCSHQTIALALVELKTKGLLGLLKNLTVFIDEAHHVCNYENAMLEENIVNSIGEFVKMVCDEPTNKMTLATATFFRGDRVPILPKELMDSFSKFRLPYDEYLRDMQYLRSLSFDFVLYQDNPVDALREIYKDGIGKGIIYLPSVNSRDAFGPKKQEVNAILDVFGASHTEDKDGLYHGTCKGKKITIADLVDDEADRKRRREFINENAKTSTGPDLIIALNMFKEGANYEALDHMVIIGPRNSLTEIVQMVGRLFRDFKGKESVKVNYFLPQSLDSADKEKAREKLNDYVKAILLSMMLEDVLCPKLTIGKRAAGDKDPAASTPTGITGMCFTDLVMDVTERQNLYFKAFNAVLDELDLDPKMGLEREKEVVSEVLTEAGYPAPENEAAVAHLCSRLNRSPLNLPSGIDPSQLDLELVKEETPLGWLPMYMSEVCDSSTFKTIRDALNSRPLYRPFEDAREFARGLKLKNHFEWESYCKSGQKPADIPVAANLVYKVSGWESWGDWLGTGFISNNKKEFLPFKDAREFARGLKLKNLKEWQAYCKSGRKPADISTCPASTYENNGWSGWGDWLGTGNISSASLQFLPYEEAEKIVRKLGIKNVKDWIRHCKSGQNAANVPDSPDVSYKDKGWKGWGEWLGTGSVSTHSRLYRPFEEAHEFVRVLKLKNREEWSSYCKSGQKPADIPADPNSVYGDKGWKGMGHWLGTGNVGPKNHCYLSYEEARAVVRSLGLKSLKEWQNYSKSKRPKSIPSHPDQSYENSGWIGWNDWLGTANIANGEIEYLPFDEARKFVRSLNLKSQTEWQAYCKSGQKPFNIPGTPNAVYKDNGWICWGDWTGTGTAKKVFVNSPASRDFRDFDSAREYARSLGLKSTTDWRHHCASGQKPVDIPTSPYLVYERDWKGWYDFLGKEDKVEFLSYLEAKKMVQKSGVKSKEGFCNWTNRPKNIPACPNTVYNNDWKGWPSFLRNETGERLPYSEAKKIARIAGIKTQKEFISWRKARPVGFPSHPAEAYKSEWKGWPAFLRGE